MTTGAIRRRPTAPALNRHVQSGSWSLGVDLSKAISLWQPWASLWCSKRKVHETRHWRCSHRGWLLVHAAKRFETVELDDQLRLILDDEFGDKWAEDLPTGALIGMVNVVNCLPTQKASR